MRFLLVFSLTFIGYCQAQALHVIIDPGHGGKDRGAVYYGVHEAHINLQVAKQLAKILKADKDFTFSLTRHKDHSLGLEERAQLARSNSGELFVSIHANAFDYPHARGVEFYFQNQLPADEEAMFLANKENDNLVLKDVATWPLKPVPRAETYKPEIISIVQDLQLSQRIQLSSKLAESMRLSWLGRSKAKDKSIKQAPFYVINNVNMPSTLIELGYLSNKSEARLLNTNHYQRKLAKSIYKGLIKFKEVMDKSLLKNLN